MELEARIFKLHYVAAEDQTRPSLNGVWFDFELGRAVATDGHCMVWTTLPVLSDFGKLFVPTERCKDILKSKVSVVEYDGKFLSYAGKSYILGDQPQYYKSIDGLIYSEVQKYMKEEDIIAIVKNKEFKVCYNPYLLVRVSKALGQSEKPKSKDDKAALVFSIRSNNGPCIVLQQNKPTALVMPMRI